MTPQIHLHVLASGSKGNASIVEGPEGSVLVDCGISRRALLGRAEELGVDVSRVVAVVLTHEHSDHVGGLSVFCNRFDGPLFATAGTVAARHYLTELPFTLVGHEDELELAGMRVRTFPTSHDVADPIGLRFSTADDALGFCTDTGELGKEALDALAGTRILALESNHDERMLATGDYPAHLKARVGGPTGHLSNAQAAEALERLVGPDTETVVAMHLSQENNRPSLCVRTLAEAVGAEVGAGEDGRPRRARRTAASRSAALPRTGRSLCGERPPAAAWICREGRRAAGSLRDFRGWRVRARAGLGIPTIGGCTRKRAWGLPRLEGRRADALKGRRDRRVLLAARAARGSNGGQH